MYWNSWAEFFAMGGYGVYVWSSFAVCAVSLCIEGVLLHRSRLQTQQQIARARMLAEMKQAGESA
ncbi:heme exporter protein CcmD [Chitinibacter sp. S2-10]|uniref:heme exporter protein CcmD n=1 Tax=Chitinibacter sp. S2-10 TaxID=3373597 RepID=UPI0039778E42